MLARRTPLRRKARLKPKRSKPRRSSRVRDRSYLLAVKQLPCALWMLRCDGEVQAHHAGRRGLGQKCSDYESIPLCRAHHRALHDGGLPWGVTDARGWLDRVIAQTRARLGLTAPETTR